MKFFPLLFIAMFSPLLLCGQYVTEKGELRKDLIIEELQSFDNGGGYQNRKREEILRALLKAKKNHPVLQKTKKKRDRVSLTIMQIDNKSGEFSFLRGNHYIDKEVDTLSLEVILLKEDLMAYKDSLDSIYNSLKIMIEDSTNTLATREKATYLLATSNHLEDVQYIFENNQSLSLSNIDYEESPTVTFGAERTGMGGLVHSNLPHGTRYNKLERNWIMFPFFIEYWGNKEWSQDLMQMWSYYLLEYVIFRKLIFGYEKPWLLVEFMKANAEDPQTEILNFIEEEFGRKSQQD